MRYIGPFFRMNSLSKSDIEGQLFYFSREAVKTIVLNSKCGIQSSFRSSNKSSSKSSHTNNISILSNFSPLVCVYKKGAPVFIHNKSSHGFDETTFRKEILPSTNALMTLSLLELSSYYSNYRNNNKKISSLTNSYNYIAKEQLDFYCNNLRNSEGVFITKKNISDGNSKGFNLIEKDKDFNFIDQALMMDAYYLFSKNHPDDEISKEYKEFSLEILKMFVDFKEALYNLSFEDGCELLFAFNLFYSFSENEKCKDIIIDISDFLINKFDEKDYYVDSLDYCCLFSIILKDAYEHTLLLSIKEKAEEILDKLKTLYDSEKNIFLKLTDKKTVKYSNLEICFYFLVMLLNYNDKENDIESRNMISALYKKYFTTSGIVTCWPDAPTLDEMERYRGFSLQSKDMIDESFFRLPNIPTPAATGTAPIFIKNVSYSKKKDSFSHSRETFDSRKNMFIDYLFIHYLKNDILKEMNFEDTKQNRADDTNEEIKKEAPIEENTSTDIISEEIPSEENTKNNNEKK